MENTQSNPPPVLQGWQKTAGELTQSRQQAPAENQPRPALPASSQHRMTRGVRGHRPLLSHRLSKDWNQTFLGAMDQNKRHTRTTSH